MADIVGRGALAEVVYDGDTVDVIIQKMLTHKYLIDMRTNINKTLDEIVAEYYGQQGDNLETHKKGTPKFKFNI